ncbi:uncharacterized protein METZ01_LOCUS505941, partial [marine metagenome]
SLFACSNCHARAWAGTSRCNHRPAWKGAT